MRIGDIHKIDVGIIEVHISLGLGSEAVESAAWVNGICADHGRNKRLRTLHAAKSCRHPNAYWLRVAEQINALLNDPVVRFIEVLSLQAARKEDAKRQQQQAMSKKASSGHA